MDEQPANQPVQPVHPSILIVPSRRPPAPSDGGPWDGYQECIRRGGRYAGKGNRQRDVRRSPCHRSPLTSGQARRFDAQDGRRLGQIRPADAEETARTGSCRLTGRMHAGAVGSICVHDGVYKQERSMSGRGVCLAAQGSRIVDNLCAGTDDTYYKPGFSVACTDLIGWVHDRRVCVVHARSHTCALLSRPPPNLTYHRFGPAQSPPRPIYAWRREQRHAVADKKHRWMAVVGESGSR